MPRRIVHIAARLRDRHESLRPFDRADWLWRALRRRFPDALAAILMPDHFHVVAPAESGRRVRASLGRVLGNFTRHFDCDPGLWRPVGEPVPVRHRNMLWLTVRYIALNECRARLARDPVEAFWSTHRDVLGAVDRPWVDATRLATALGHRGAGFLERYQAFVSKDSFVSVEGTPLPIPAHSALEPTVCLDAIASAAAAALRLPADAVQDRGAARALFLALARDQGWRGRAAFVEATASSPTTVNRLLAAPVPPTALHAARLCLGDERLTRTVPAPGCRRRRGSAPTSRCRVRGGRPSRARPMRRS